MRFQFLIVCLIAGWFGVHSAVAGEALHRQIDQLVSQNFEGRVPSPQTDDAEFLRRISLDLAGRVPTATETRQFLSDSSDKKRTELIDRLLAAPSYAQQMENQFHILLLERRGDHPEWRSFLRACFEANMPWDEMVRQILSPDDQDEQKRGAAFFYTERLKAYGQNPVDYSGLTRDVGRLFLGVDLQCAECHNHLFIEDYDQQEFQGLFSVYKNLSIRREKFPAVTEKAMTEKLEFVSVFNPEKRVVGPKIPFGKEFEIPVPKEDAEKKPAAKKKPAPGEKPEFSALDLIGNNLPTSNNELFAKSIANRLWHLMLGRGLVEPLDQFHSGNAPSHPELLDLLADELTAHKFDIKWMLRELALSETYQRSSKLSDDGEVPPASSYLVALERRLSAEQLLASTLVATGNYERLSKLSEKADADSAEKDTAAEGEEEEMVTLKDLEKLFVKAFANDAREPELEFTPSVKAALLVLNDEKVLSLTRPAEGNLVERLSKTGASTERTDELFLSLFTRFPTEEERQAVDRYLAENSKNATVALGHVVWSMMSSIEFCINH